MSRDREKWATSPYGNRTIGVTASLSDSQHGPENPRVEDLPSLRESASFVLFSFGQRRTATTGEIGGLN